MAFKVLNTFREKEHEGTVYQEGKIYPKDNFEADPKRVEFLQKRHSEYDVAFLGPLESEPKPKPQEVTTTEKVTAKETDNDLVKESGEKSKPKKTVSKGKKSSDSK